MAESSIARSFERIVVHGESTVLRVLPWLKFGSDAESWDFFLPIFNPRLLNSTRNDVARPFFFFGAGRGHAVGFLMVDVALTPCALYRTV